MSFAVQTTSARHGQNNLLRALREEDYGLISSSLIAEDKQAGDLLYRPGDNIAQVYFPCGPSLVAYLVTSIDGREVESVLVGREGAVGGIVSSGHLPAYCMITVKFGGPFLRAPVATIEDAKEKSATFKRLFRVTPIACWRRSFRQPPVMPFTPSSNAPPSGFSPRWIEPGIRSFP